MGKPRKRQQLGPAAVLKALEAGGTQAQVAQRLGINRSTLHRWRVAGLLPGPRGLATTSDGMASDGEVLPRHNLPEPFASWATRTYDLSPAELELVSLAQSALDLARGSDVESTRLAAMREFRACLKQLALPATDAAEDAEPRRATWRA